MARSERVAAAQEEASPLLRAHAANTTVLIPAAGRVPESIMALSNIGTPAMIPVGGRPVVHWTVSYLLGLGFTHFVIAVPERGLFVEEYLQCVFGDACEIDFLVPGEDSGLGQTVSELSACVQTRSSLVVLGDTYFRFSQPADMAFEENLVLVHPVEDSYRWCVVGTDEVGNLVELFDKEPGMRGSHPALIGVYYFADTSQLQKAAKDACDSAAAKQRRVEMGDVLEQVRRVSSIRVIPTEEWLDCGNPDRQAASHRALLQARAFNELDIDPVFGSITKTSRNVEKFIDEINYLRLLPPELGPLFPRVLEYDIDWRRPWVKMEYYGYPSLSDVFVYENVDPGVWEQVFRHLFSLLQDGFLRWERPLSKKAVREMYLDKTRERLAALSDHPVIAPLLAHEGSIEVNGKALLNLPQLWEVLKEQIKALENNVQGSIIHGDLCLSNILYDLRSRIVKLIDPRGSFGNAGIYGDIRYDVAKLYHSIYGHYDLIVNDLFDLEVDGQKVSLTVRTQNRHGEILERFQEVFFPTFDRKEITLITGILFASMPALHYDAPRRQIAMYIRSLEILNEALGVSP